MLQIIENGLTITGVFPEEMVRIVIDKNFIDKILKSLQNNLKIKSLMKEDLFRLIFHRYKKFKEQNITTIMESLFNKEYNQYILIRELKPENNTFFYSDIDSYLNKIKISSNECPHCKFISTLFNDFNDFNENDYSNREYWIITEIFVYLHDGKDYCNWEEKNV